MAVIINAIFVTVSLLSLKKTFHNILVTLLCVSDESNCISAATFASIRIFDHIDVTISCRFFIYCIAFSFLTSYSIILLITILRYDTVKNLNCGNHNKFERNKFKIFINFFFNSRFVFRLTSHKNESMQHF